MHLDIWKNEINTQLISESDQHVKMEFSHNMLSSTIMLSFVYGSCDGRVRRTLWQDLISSSTSSPWLVVGDFNVVLNQEEKLGGCHINLNECAEFSNMISQVGLTNMGYTGSKFTWHNNRLSGSTISERQDRALGNTESTSKFFTKVEHLNRTCSDHTPLLISINNLEARGGSFRFLNVWAYHHQFMEVVKEAWNTNIQGRPMVRFFNKLKEVERRLQVWNREIFGQVGQRVKHAEDQVLAME